MSKTIDPPTMDYYRADAEFRRLEAERDRILNADDATGFVAAQNALAARSRGLRNAYYDEQRRAGASVPAWTI